MNVNYFTLEISYLTSQKYLYLAEENEKICDGAQRTML